MEEIAADQWEVIIEWDDVEYEFVGNLTIRNEEPVSVDDEGILISAGKSAILRVDMPGTMTWENGKIEDLEPGYYLIDEQGLCSFPEGIDYAE